MTTGHTSMEMNSTASYYDMSYSIAHMLHFTFMSYLEPVFILTGTLGNLSILAVFGRPEAGKFCGKTTRLYYVMIATFDLFTILGFKLIVGFLDYGLENVTSGEFHPGDIQRASDVACKIVWPIYFVSEQLSGFTLVTFSLERLCAVYFPLSVKKYWPYKSVRLGLLAMVVIDILLNVHVEVFIKRLPTPGSNSYEICLPDPNSPLGVELFWIAYGILNYGLPTSIVFVTNLCILARLARQSERRSSLLSSERSAAESQKQKIATASLVLVACLHAFLFIPAAVTLCLEAFIYIGLVQATAEQSATIVEIGYFCYHLTTLSKTLNCVIYYFRVPYFRQTVRSVAKCKCANSKAAQLEQKN